MKQWKKNLIIILVTAIISGCIASIGTFVVTNILFLVGHHDMFTKMREVKSTLDNLYLYDYDYDKYVDGAISGAVASLDEPYTEYYSKKEFDSLKESLSGDFVGIGASVISNEANQIQVVNPIEGGAAIEAGIQSGDIIAVIDNKPYTGEELDDAVAHMRGEEGTTVNIVVLRGEEELPFTLTRRRIHNKSVAYEKLDGEIGYIQIDSFTTPDDEGAPSAYDEFQVAYDELTKSQKVQKLIIDLRDNGGGDADVVTKIADILVGEGVVFSMEYKDGIKEVKKSTKGECNLPIVVLVNGNSASASELLSGCLRDHGKAKLVGTKTFGKGVVQSVFPFSDGTGLKLTVAKYYTPNGICVQDNGLDPDYVCEPLDKYKNFGISIIPRDEDVQLAKAIEVLNDWK